MKTDKAYQTAKNELLAQTRREKLAAVREAREVQQVELIIDEILDEIRSQGETEPGSKAELALLMLMLAKRYGSTETQRAAFALPEDD